MKTVGPSREEIIDRIFAGEFLAVGEYRNSRAEMLTWRDKTNGQQRSAPILRHTVEFGNVSAAVNERVPDGTKIEDIHVPFNKGDMVVCALTELSQNLGQVAARGALSRLVLPSPAGNGPRSPGLGTPVGREPSPVRS